MFRVEAIRVTHSIVDALGYAIVTPTGKIIHTSDFKVDHTPSTRRPPTWHASPITPSRASRCW